MGRYLMDNNAISHFFSGVLTDNGMRFVADIIDKTPTISVITEIEALSWVNPNKEKEEIVKSFIEDALVMPLTPAVVLQCVKLRRSKKIKTPDAIIAATAIVNNCTLITSDKDFNTIVGLSVLNPFDL